MTHSAPRTVPIHFRNRVIHVPVGPDGGVDIESLKREAGIPRERIVVETRDDGENHVLPSGGRAVLPSGTHVADIAPHRRGAPQ